MNNPFDAAQRALFFSEDGWLDERREIAEEVKRVGVLGGHSNTL